MNLPMSLHFIRLAWLDFFNLRDIHMNGYNLTFAYADVYNMNGLRINSFGYPLPSHNLVLSLQLAISTLEKLLKSVRSYEGLSIEKLGHSLRKALDGLDMNKKYALASGLGHFSLSQIAATLPELWDVITDLNYTDLRYESKLDGSPTKHFQVSLKYASYGQFIDSVKTFLQNWFDFITTTGNHEIEYPSDLNLMHIVVYAPGKSDLGEVFASEDKYIIITNKPENTIDLSMP